MSSEHPKSGEGQSREVRLGRILNEFQDQRARGETVSETELLAAHPDLAGELRCCLAPFLELRSAKASPAGPLANALGMKPFGGVYPKAVGAFQTIEMIGHGGMGIVLKARDTALDRVVALKILRPEYADDPVAMERFSREARAAAGLNHANIVTVHAIGMEGDVPFIAMEYVDGPTLAQVINERGPLPADTIRRFFSQILSGLAAAHEAGLVHRDIKAANILLDEERRHLKIADFGLARISAVQTRITMPESIMGTAEYMSPEQARGAEDIDHRTDLYSAGVVLYEMLTGRKPFAGGKPDVVIYRIQNEEPAHPLTIWQDAEPHLASLAVRLLAKRPQDRFASAGEALLTLSEESKVPSLEGRRRLRRRASLIGIGLLIVTAIVCVALKSPAAIEARVNPNVESQIQIRHEGESNWSVLRQYAPEYLPRNAALIRAASMSCVVATAREWFGTKHEVLQAISLSGEELWRSGIPEEHKWPDQQYSDEKWWIALRVREIELNGISGHQAVVLARHRKADPSRITIYRVDDDGLHAMHTFWHYGHLRDFEVVAGLLPDGRPGIVAWGHNDALSGAQTETNGHVQGGGGAATHGLVNVLMILDPNAMDGQGPRAIAAGSPSIPDCSPLAYAYLDMPVTAHNLRPELMHEPDDESKLKLGTRLELNTITRQEDGTLAFEFSVSATTSGEFSRCMLTFDESLKLQKAVPTSIERKIADTTPQFWSDRWVSIYRDSEQTETWRQKLREREARSRSLED